MFVYVFNTTIHCMPCKIEQFKNNNIRQVSEVLLEYGKAEENNLRILEGIGGYCQQLC